MVNRSFSEGKPMDVTKLLATVLRWGRAAGLDEQQTATAQSLAWYYAAAYDGPELPVSHWARLGVRATLRGRDLPGCGTGSGDALHRVWQGAGMGEVADRRPPPDEVAS